MLQVIEQPTVRKGMWTSFGQAKCDLLGSEFSPSTEKGLFKK